MAYFHKHWPSDLVSEVEDAVWNRVSPFLSLYQVYIVSLTLLVSQSFQCLAQRPQCQVNTHPQDFIDPLTSWVASTLGTLPKQPELPWVQGGVIPCEVPKPVAQASAWRETSYRRLFGFNMRRSRIAKGAQECGTLENAKCDTVGIGRKRSRTHFRVARNFEDPPAAIGSVSSLSC
jgi:hypothetical protein